MRTFLKPELVWCAVVVAALAQFMTIAVPMACDALAAAGMATAWSLLLPVLCGWVAPDISRALTYGPACCSVGGSAPA